MSEAPKKDMMAVAYLFPVISLFFLPIVFMIVGIVFGAMNIARGYSGHGVIQMILSGLCGIIGIVSGAVIGAALIG